jgi:carboxypeptidase family protein/Big-like domain-containing protein
MNWGERFVIVAAAGVMTACTGNPMSGSNPVAPTPPAATVAAVSISTGAPAGASMQLNATARMTDGTTRDVTMSARWESSNPQLATISSTGMMTVVGSGDIDVRATYQGVAGSMHLTVHSPQTFTLSGVVAEAPPQGGPIVGARVQVVPNDHVFTDAHGVFSIAHVQAGRLILEVTKDGFQTWSNELTISGDTQLPTITLMPAPSQPARR